MKENKDEWFHTIKERRTIQLCTCVDYFYKSQSKDNPTGPKRKQAVLHRCQGEGRLKAATFAATSNHGECNRGDWDGSWDCNKRVKNRVLVPGSSFEMTIREVTSRLNPWGFQRG